MNKASWQELEPNMSCNNSETRRSFCTSGQRMVWHVARVTEAKKKLSSLSGLCSSVTPLMGSTEHMEVQGTWLCIQKSFPKQHQGGYQEDQGTKYRISRRSKKSQEESRPKRPLDLKPAHGTDREAPRRLRQG